MARISIKNIGPIKDADFELNKVNLFIGPQSSGKSTLAKLVSFCLWLEKYIIINQGKEAIDAEFMRLQLIAFHGFENYFVEDSYLGFDSDLISLKYSSPDKFTLGITGDISKGLMSKVAYVPSERNILSFPNISSLQLGDNYIRGFIFDWLSIRSKYTVKNHYKVLNLGADYYFDESRGDVISLDNGKELTLSESSSGVQAVIPLLVYVDYITKWIYENNADVSFDKYASLQKSLLKSVLSEKKTDFTIEEALESPHVKGAVNTLLNKLSKLRGQVSEEDVPIISLIKRVGMPHSTKLVIEECEMNVFPSTQYELVKQIVAAMNFDRGDMLLLTTHSPYVMTSMNNLIQAGSLADNGGSARYDIDKIIPSCSWLNYKDVSAWAVDKGMITSINDDEYELISSDELDKASDKISNDFSNLIPTV